MPDIKQLAFAREQNVAKTWLERNKYTPNFMPKEVCLMIFSLSLRNWDKLHLCSEKSLESS